RAPGATRAPGPCPRRAPWRPRGVPAPGRPPRSPGIEGARPAPAATARDAPRRAHPARRRRSPGGRARRSRPTPPPDGPRSPPDRERGARGRSLERLAAGRTATSSFTDAHVRPLRAKFTAAAGSVHESLGRRCRQVGDELARDAVQELDLRGLLLVYAGFHAQREGQGSLALVGQRLAHSIPAAQGLS